ncbi:MAG: glycosyltransferase [Chryseobacterium sp.]|nr:MAG: glycosyltransferase [Chryseobacterium sp.]
MKISIITVVYNAEQYIKDCIESIVNQSYHDIEYIIIDGGSTDGTLLVIEEYHQYIAYFVSEKDEGLYDAINKGIKLATGEVVGLLNADDILVSNEVIAKVAKAFINQPETQAVYGDLNYVTPASAKIIREWRSHQADKIDIEKGWMPAHPTFYVRKQVYESYGGYALDMGTAADYDLMLRYFHTYSIKAIYLPFLMVNMRTGGLSNKGISSLWKAMKYDYKALRRNSIPNALLVLIKKKLIKMSQF